MTIRHQRQMGAIWGPTVLLVFVCSIRPGLPANNWRDLKQAAIQAELNNDDKLSASLYSDALKITPPANLNDRAEMYARSGTLYAQLNNYAEAGHCVTELGKAVNALNTSKTCDPEVLPHIAFFSDQFEKAMSLCRHSKYHHERAKGFYDKAMELRNMVSPGTQDANEHQLKMAKYFADLNQDPFAEESLSDLLHKLKANNKERDKIALYLAAVQFKLGKPAALIEETKSMSKHHSPVEVSKNVAAAHLWAANYQQALKDAEKASSLFQQAKKSDLKTEIGINNLFGDIYYDQSEFKKADPYYHKSMDLEAAKDKMSEDYRVALKTYVNVLEHQHRQAEAAAVLKEKPKTRKGLEWMLGDEEQKMLKEERSKSPNH